MQSKPQICSGCPLANKGQGFVSPRGTVFDWPNIKLLVQGEAPARDEVDEGAAFVGKAGFWIRHNIFGNAGVPAAQTIFDNTLRCWPPRNKQGEFYPIGKERIEAEKCCRQYDVWHLCPLQIPLLVVGGKAGNQYLESEKISDYHGHIAWINGRLTGFTFHPAAVMRKPNFLPVVVREVSNLMQANANPAVLDRPRVHKTCMPYEDVSEFVTDLEWNIATDKLTVVGVAYRPEEAFSTYDTEVGLSLVRHNIQKGMRLIGHNLIDADLPRIGAWPVSWKPEHVIDTMIVGHLIHAHFAEMGLLDLGSLVRFYFPTTDWKQDKTDLLQYNGLDCAYNMKLWQALKDDLTLTKQWHLVEKHQRLAAMTVQMHEDGVRINPDAVVKLVEERTIQREKLREELPLNPNSPKQIVKWANELGIRIDNSKYETIEKHRGKHPLFDKLITYRDDVKSIKTWFPYDEEDGHITVPDFIYAQFHATGTDVDRFSCSGPNCQNIPPHLRHAIVARSDELELVAFDYSQIENRCVAWYAEDAQMLQDFALGLDIHRLVASRIFNKPYDNVTNDERQEGKKTVHASGYCETPFSLAQRISGNRKRESIERAKFLQDLYFKAYHRTRGWQNRVGDQLDKGDVMMRNAFGRVRFIYAQDRHERMKRGCHFLGCSTAADIVNERMIWIHDALPDIQSRYAPDGMPMGLHPLLIVHDELVFELPKGEEGLRYRKVIKEIMGQPVAQMNGFQVPVKVKVGSNYGTQTEANPKGLVELT